MAKVIRITEQDLSKILSDVLNMTGIFGEKKKENKKGLESDKSLGKTSAKGQELLSNPIFKQKLKEISSENSIGCVGLIQFCPDNRGGSSKTINGKTYSLNELREDLELQLNAIKEFWLKGKRDGKIKNAKDLYVYNFFPIAAGKSDDYVLQTKGLSAEKIARQNPVFNKTLGRPVDTPLTVGDLSDYFQMKGMI